MLSKITYNLYEVIGMNITGKRLKDLRTAKGLSQEEMSKVLGIGRTTYLKYENGDIMPTRKLKELSQFFNVTTDYILGNDIDDSDGYYLDPETAKLAQELKDNPDYRALMDATRRLKPESVKEIMAFIKFQKAKEEGL